MAKEEAGPARSSLFDPDALFRKHLHRGFSALDNEEDPDTTTDSLFSTVLVNVTDPTSFASSVISKAKKPLELFSKIQYLFEKHNQSTLRNVPYQHFRSGKGGILDKLALGLVMENTHGGVVSLGVGADSSTTDSKTMLTEYHTQYYCHVYIAACDTMENYRLKVKPSIQAFLSQLEAATGTTTGSSSTMPNYLIIFVPTGEFEEESTPTGAATTTTQQEAPRSRVASFASRIVRQRMGGVTTTTDESDDTNGQQQGDSTTSETTTITAPTTTMSKLDRDILKRLTADFAGRVSPLAFLRMQDEDVFFSKTEWETFLQQLGAVCVEGFRDRCRHYDEQLRKLKSNDDVTLWLAKESLAFTYQQMRQPAEALLQYEELRALLPDLQQETSQSHDYSLSQLALRGYIKSFRESVRTADSLASIAYELEHYLLVRETSQMFAMHNPGAVVKRCKTFATMMFSMMIQRSSDQANTWALEFCWDVVTACQGFTFQDEEFALALCDLLSFARLRLLKLAKARLPDYKGTHLGDSTLPPEFRKKWDPWVEREMTAENKEDDDGALDLSETNLVSEAMSSKEGFESVYMKLTKLLATSCDACNRTRHAALLRHEVVNIAVRSNKLRSAARELGEVAKVYESDGWDACNFFLLFRLAILQRQVESAPNYFQTLVRCFSVTAAPPKAVAALFDDLVAVIGSLSKSGHRMAAAPIFKPILSLENYEMARVIGTDRNLFKKVYSTGDTVSINVSVTSQLPKPIQLKALSVTLVPFRTYVGAMEDHISLKEEDSFQVLTLSDVELAPGHKDYVYEWVPQLSGQFILSAFSMNWENSIFTYTAKEMKRPTIRIDVIPCDPTQSLQIKPDYIVPGHEQTLEVVFSSVSDTVYSGSVKLVGSPGLLVRREDTGKEESWKSSVEIELPRCSAGGEVSTRVSVDSTVEQDYGAVATLHAQAFTLFRRENQSEHTKSIETDDDAGLLECTVDAKVSTLGKRAFSVTDVDMVAYSADRLLINASLRCHAPTVFLLQKWSIDLPSYLTLPEDGDLNESLANSNITSGESLSLAFDCRVLDDVPPFSEGTLVLVFDNGSGTTFTDSYTLRLRRPSVLPIPKAETVEASITLYPSTTEGMVGHPIDIACAIDTTGVSLDGKDIRYTAATNANDWVLSGKTEGVLRTKDSTRHELNFVAIPTRPGPMSQYLTMSLTIEDDNGRLLELPVKFVQPESFQSMDPPNHPTVAFPVIPSFSE
jgi:hypothetical protein